MSVKTLLSFAWMCEYSVFTVSVKYTLASVALAVLGPLLTTKEL